MTFLHLFFSPKPKLSLFFTPFRFVWFSSSFSLSFVIYFNSCFMSVCLFLLLSHSLHVSRYQSIKVVKGENRREERKERCSSFMHGINSERKRHNKEERMEKEDIKREKEEVMGEERKEAGDEREWNNVLCWKWKFEEGMKYYSWIFKDLCMS